MACYTEGMERRAKQLMSSAEAYNAISDYWDAQETPGAKTIKRMQDAFAKEFQAPSDSITIRPIYKDLSGRAWHLEAECDCSPVANKLYGACIEYGLPTEYELMYGHAKLPQADSV
jgi:hypothetical protein